MFNLANLYLSPLRRNMKDETIESHILLGNNSSEFDELDEHQIEDFESIYFENLIQ